MSKNKEKVDRRKFLKMSAVGAAGGAAGDAGMTVSLGGNTLLGFSFSNTEIPAGTGVLTVLSFSAFTADTAEAHVPAPIDKFEPAAMIHTRVVLQLHLLGWNQSRDDMLDSPIIERKQAC